MGAVLGLLVFVACISVGGTLLGTGHTLAGIIVTCCCIPGAIVAWVKWNDRM